MAFFGPSYTSQQNAATSAATGQITQQTTAPDWRVKLGLAPQAGCLYKIASNTDIMYPLLSTDGVIFPYTPKIDLSYNADYESYNLVHTNFTGYFYKHSHVGEVTISCDFTAQSQSEADYLLAVIHFFRSATRMFYGQDVQPQAGTPPPVCLLNGLGQYQFNNQPVLIRTFNYSLPSDVDYIRAGSVNYEGGQVNLQSIRNQTYSTSPFDAVTNRLQNSGLGSIKGILNQFLPRSPQTLGPSTGSIVSNITQQPTYVPTKINISVTLLPVISRTNQAQNYSTSKYATGAGIADGYW